MTGSLCPKSVGLDVSCTAYFENQTLLGMTSPKAGQASAEDTVIPSLMQQGARAVTKQPAAF